MTEPKALAISGPEADPPLGDGSRYADLQAEAQEWERQWWGDCLHTFGEEAKQLTYAHLMGLVNEPREGKWPYYDLRGASVLDLGGGPCSILLKTVGGWGIVVDPCEFPEWVRHRYETAGIRYVQQTAETFDEGVRLTECWIYNVLQHVEDPELVIATARRNAHVLRIFDWLETEATDGHPHTLHADDLNDWIGSAGNVRYVEENGAVGLCYHGCFAL